MRAGGGAAPRPMPIAPRAPPAPSLVSDHTNVTWQKAYFRLKQNRSEGKRELPLDTPFCWLVFVEAVDHVHAGGASRENTIDW